MEWKLLFSKLATFCYHEKPERFFFQRYLFLMYIDNFIITIFE